MPDFHARSRSVSIPSKPNPALNNFSGRHSLMPPGPRSEQLSFSSVQTTANGTTSASSHWKTLSNHFRFSQTKSISGPRATEVFQSPPPRQRTIVRKSLRITEVSQATMMTSFPVKGKPEEVDSDDEVTLVSVSGGEIPAPNNEETEKMPSEEEKRPDKKSSRVSKKILTVIPDIYNDADNMNRSTIQEPQEKGLYSRKSLHWGLRSSPYQPEFIIEKEGERDNDMPFTSLSPPPSVHRRQSAFTPRRM